MNNLSLEALAGELLRQRKWRLATAESCTGGLIAHRLTNVPGSSDYYLGGIIAYANEVKMNQLNVNTNTLEQSGAVSQETVIEMARGVRSALHADIGLSVSGIAGPGGGSPDKPVGLVWIGLTAPGYEQANRYLWEGNRLRVKEQSAEQALKLLVEFLQR